MEPLTIMRASNADIHMYKPINTLSKLHLPAALGDVLQLLAEAPALLLETLDQVTLGTQQAVQLPNYTHTRTCIFAGTDT